MTLKEELIYANEQIKVLKEQLEAAKAAIVISLDAFDQLICGTWSLDDLKVFLYSAEKEMRKQVN